MQGLSLFGLLIVFAVTAAQIAGHNKREKEKNQNQGQGKDGSLDPGKNVWREDLKHVHSEEIYEEDSKEYVDASHTSDDYNPFEAH